MRVVCFVCEPSRARCIFSKEMGNESLVMTVGICESYFERDWGIKVISNGYFDESSRVLDKSLGMSDKSLRI